MQNANTFAYDDGPRVGRPITGGASWFSRWTANRATSTPVPVNEPPDGNYQPRSTLSLAQQRLTDGRAADPWSSIAQSHFLGGLFGWALPVARPLPNTTNGKETIRTTQPVLTAGPLKVSTTTQPNTTPPNSNTTTGGGSVASSTPGTTDDGSQSDPTVALETSILNGATQAQPLGGIGATVPVEQQTIGASSGGGSSIAILGLLAIGLGALVYLYIRRKQGKGAPQHAES